MISRTARRALAVLGSITALFGGSTVAQASPLLLFDVQLVQGVIATQSSTLCLSYVYDANGNRLSQSSAVLGSSAVTWGSGTYGCFYWSAS